jgi:hypothetical protein
MMNMDHSYTEIGHNELDFGNDINLFWKHPCHSREETLGRQLS